MSMLAEPRKKQKWSIDPRNSAWSKDDNKFGQKMLERMGWSKGKGLGRSEQGSTEHVKVKVKNNSYGLGTNVSHEDNWIAHQDDFNDLLAQLNTCHGQNENNESPEPSEEQKGFSLEEKSKTARKRVHYMKFTKGKDLSSRSEKDLNCIFGKRGRSTKEQDQESNSSDSQEKEEATVIAPTELDTETITNTVTSALSMQEYFAQRMARFKQAKRQAPNSDKSAQSSPTHDSSTERPKKKNKKNKSAAEEAEVFEVCKVEHIEPQHENPEKKKKRKRHEKEPPEAQEEEKPPSKKKKSKKQKKDTEQMNELFITEDDDVILEDEDTNMHDDEIQFVEKSKDQKKKKKKLRK